MGRPSKFEELFDRLQGWPVYAGDTLNDKQLSMLAATLAAAANSDDMFRMIWDLVLKAMDRQDKQMAGVLKGMTPAARLKWIKEKAGD